MDGNIVIACCFQRFGVLAGRSSIDRALHDGAALDLDLAVITHADGRLVTRLDPRARLHRDLFVMAGRAAPTVAPCAPPAAVQVVLDPEVVQLAHAAVPWNPRASASKVGATPCPAGLLRRPRKPGPLTVS